MYSKFHRIVPGSLTLLGVMFSPVVSAHTGDPATGLFSGMSHPFSVLGGLVHGFEIAPGVAGLTFIVGLVASSAALLVTCLWIDLNALAASKAKVFNRLILDYFIKFRRQ